MYEKGQARAVDATTKMVAAVGLAYSQLSTYPKWYLDLSGLIWTGLESVKKTIFKNLQVIRNLTSTKLIKETSDLLKKQSFIHKE